MIDSRDTTAAGEGFLGRWSRLKRGDAAETGATLPAAAGVGSEPAPPAEAPPLTDADMPPIESLGDDSDFSGFLSAGVSDALRQQALRKLFGLPMCQVLDGLNDYDDDFTQFETLGSTITYQMKQWAERKAREQADNHARGDRETLAAESAPPADQSALDGTADACGDGDLENDA